MKTLMSRLGVAVLLGWLPGASHGLDVFVCEPEWGALVAELAGELATVTVATTAFQDPHRLQARPSIIARARNADLLVCTGAELEVGWLPLLLRRAGNPAIQPGNPGHFLAADYVRKIEVPVRLDRSEGDVHPQGNPHVHLNPHNITRVAKKLSRRLALVDGGDAQRYQARLDSFLARWGAAIDAWEGRGETLAGLRLVTYHRSFSYLADWLDLDVVATLETKPGISPSGSHLAKLLEQLSAVPPAAVVRTPFDNEKPAAWLSERLTVSAVLLPYTVGSTDAVVDLFSLFDETLARLEEVGS
jgi:zinc/manganese transport system substrate-binding protein